MSTFRRASGPMRWCRHACGRCSTGMPKCRAKRWWRASSLSTRLHAKLSDPGVLETLRRELNESYPSFYCDALLCSTTPVRDKEKLAASSTFEGTMLRIAREDASDPQGQLSYLQEEFSRRGLSVPRSVAQRLAALSERAEDRLLTMVDGEERR